MARKDSSSVQLNFFEDHFKHSCPAIQNAIIKSWAGPFGDRLFPLIEESIFDPLYSSLGRPSAPINVMYSACLLQILLDISEDELFLRILTDLSFQYALHTTTNEVLPFSRSTYHRFKTKLLMHYIATDEDLFKLCNKEIVKRLLAQDKPVPRFLKRIGKLTVDNLRSEPQKNSTKTK